MTITTFFLLSMLAYTWRHAGLLKYFVNPLTRCFKGALDELVAF